MTAISVKDVRRRDGYYHLFGQKYVSVTTILQAMAKPALISWAAKTAAANVLDDPETYDTSEKAAASIYEARDKAADRGSAIHSLVEAVLLGNIPETISESHAKRFAAFSRWVETARPKVIETEATVLSDRHHYAGTTDLICQLGTRTGLVDIKTGKAIYPEAALQLSAYRHADSLVTKDLTPLRLPMPTIEFTAVLLLSDDGTTTFREVDAPLEVFLALKKVFEWSKEAR